MLGAIGYAALLWCISTGLVDGSILTGASDQIRVGGERGGLTVDFDEPGGATWPVVVPLLADRRRGSSRRPRDRRAPARLFDSFTSGEPFRRENATHLRVIWITMLAIEVSRYLLLGVTSVLIAAFGTPDGTDRAVRSQHRPHQLDGRSSYLIVLAEVFREGARLKEEQELTI